MKKHFQTMYFVSKIGRIKFIGKPIQRTIQKICGFFGHQLSETDWGYGGGDYADVWCKWCDKIIKVKKEDLLVIYPGSAHLMNMIGKDIDKSVLSEYIRNSGDE